MNFNIFPRLSSFVIQCLEVIKMVIASVASVALLGFAGLIISGSTVGLVVSTPLFIIFSPILVPATVATTLLATGLTAGVSLGGTALGLVIWLIKHGIFADKPTGEAAPAGGATPPASEAAPAAPAGGGTGIPKIMGSVKWTITRDGTPFSGGWWGGTPVGESVGGNKPGIVLTWVWTSWRGKTRTGNVPLGGIPASGGTPAE